MDGMLAGQRASRRLARIDSSYSPAEGWVVAAGTTVLVDLVADALSFLMSE